MRLCQNTSGTKYKKWCLHVNISVFWVRTPRSPAEMILESGKYCMIGPPAEIILKSGKYCTIGPPAELILKSGNISGICLCFSIFWWIWIVLVIVRVIVFFTRFYLFYVQTGCVSCVFMIIGVVNRSSEAVKYLSHFPISRFFSCQFSHYQKNMIIHLSSFSEIMAIRPLGIQILCIMTAIQTTFKGNPFSSFLFRENGPTILDKNKWTKSREKKKLVKGDK